MAATTKACRILEYEPELADGLSDADREAATRAMVAPVLEASGPTWYLPDYEHSRTYGLLVLEGLLGRRLRVGSAVATELLSSGDILRPWDEPIPFGAIAPILEWRVFSPARVAVLDARITTLIGRRPELTVNFASRLLRRLRSASYLSAVSHQTRVEDKLLATLWQMAGSWGKVTPTGVRLPFRLTHEVLGEIVGAQRPSITTALRRMAEQGLIARSDDGRIIVLRMPTEPGPEDPVPAVSAV